MFRGGAAWCFGGSSSFAGTVATVAAPREPSRKPGARATVAQVLDRTRLKGGERGYAVVEVARPIWQSRFRVGRVFGSKNKALEMALPQAVQARNDGCVGTEECVIEEADLRALVRLVAQAAVQRGGLMGKRCYVLDGLCDFAGAQEWEWAVEDEPGRGLRLMRRRIDYPYLPALPPEPTVVPLADFPGEGPRRILVGRVVSQGQSWIALNRGEGERAYTERERRLTYLVLNQLHWLHGRGGRQQAPARELSARLQLVLDLLMIGLQRKEIAAQIGISMGTVSGYVRDLYRHFEVNSHAELIRKQSRKAGRTGAG